MGIALIVSHLLTEAHSILLWAWPKASTFDVHWFWSNIDFKINILWWVKLTVDHIMQIVLYFIMAKIANQYSKKLFLIICVYFFYHFIDLLLYFYNYSQTVWVYWSLLACTIGATIILIRPIKEGGVYKSMV